MVTFSDGSIAIVSEFQMFTSRSGSVPSALGLLIVALRTTDKQATIVTREQEVALRRILADSPVDPGGIPFDPSRACVAALERASMHRAAAVFPIHFVETLLELPDLGETIRHALEIEPDQLLEELRRRQPEDVLSRVPPTDSPGEPAFVVVVRAGARVDESNRYHTLEHALRAQYALRGDMVSAPAAIREAADYIWIRPPAWLDEGAEVSIRHIDA